MGKDNNNNSLRSGNFPAIFIPPLAVILVGILISFFTSGLFLNQSVNASRQPGKVDKQILINSNIDTSDIISNNSGSPDISIVFTPEVRFWAGKIHDWSIQYGLDPNLVATVMQIESCGDPEAISSAGAMGLFQVMPFHFSESDQPMEPDVNAMRGLAYLKKSYDQADGDIRLTLAGYNGGIGVIGMAEENWADETHRYVYWGSGIYMDASQGYETSSYVNEWYGKWGRSLCNQAAARIGLLY